MNTACCLLVPSVIIDQQVCLTFQLPEINEIGLGNLTLVRRWRWEGNCRSDINFWTDGLPWGAISPFQLKIWNSHCLNCCSKNPTDGFCLCPRRTEPFVLFYIFIYFFSGHQGTSVVVVGGSQLEMGPKRAFRQVKEQITIIFKKKSSWVNPGEDKSLLCRSSDPEVKAKRAWRLHTWVTLPHHPLPPTAHHFCPCPMPLQPLPHLSHCVASEPSQRDN